MRFLRGWFLAATSSAAILAGLSACLPDAGGLATAPPDRVTPIPVTATSTATSVSTATSGLTLPSAPPAATPTTPTPQAAPPAEPPESILGQGAAAFIATTQAELTGLLARLGEEDAGNIDGPLAAAMMQQAGLLGDEIDPHRLWLLDPVEDWEKLESILPHEAFAWARRDGPPEGMDFGEEPLYAGDLVYFIPARDRARGKFAFVHRVDEGGAAYAMLNVWDEAAQAYLVEEVGLYDPGQATGQAFPLSRIEGVAYQGMLVWRKRDYSGMPQAEAALNRVLNRGGTWRALVKEVGGPAAFERYADATLHPASVIKVALGMLVVEALQADGMGLAEGLQAAPPRAGRTYEQLLHAMLTLSEETATDILEADVRARLGDETIRSVLDGWGAAHTQLTPRRSSARDTVALLEGLYDHSLIGDEGSQLLLRYLAEVTENDKIRLWRLADALPEEAVIYNKRGSLTDPVIVADAGIVALGDGRAYLLCLYGYADDWTTFEELDAIIGDFALEWYQEMTKGD